MPCFDETGQEKYCPGSDEEAMREERERDAKDKKRFFALFERLVCAVEKLKQREE
jgi:hypothetical protein